jgi:PAS domain S-box-containing protein
LDTSGSGSVATGRPAEAGAWRDLVLVVVATTLTFVLAGRFELSEGIGGWLTHFERYQLDELPAAIIVMIAGLAWFSWRRSRHAAREMTLRLAAQEALNAQQAHFRELFHEDLSGNMLADGDGTIRLANPELARILGHAAPADAIGRRIADFYADATLWARDLEALGRGERIETSGLRLARTDGSVVSVIARLSRRRGPSGRVEIHGFFADVTALEDVRTALATALAENRLLAQRGIEMLEEERRHIARELHDEMGQWLNALKIDAVSIRDRGDMPQDVRVTAQSIVELSDHVYDVARELMRRLRPVALDELGLVSALQYSIEQWRRRQPGVRCAFDADDRAENLGEVVNITLYRMVQECLTNIAKHAGASEVEIGIAFEEGGVAVAVFVRDNGCGFDSREPRAGLGLVGLRERIESLGGRFSVEGGPGRGTEVRARVPAGPVDTVDASANAVSTGPGEAGVQA